VLSATHHSAPGSPADAYARDPGGLLLVGRARLGDHLAVRRLPQLDGVVSLGAEHDRVVPPPHHGLAALRSGSDCNQVTGCNSLPPRRGKGRREPHESDATVAHDLARVLLDSEDEGGCELVGALVAIVLRSGHVGIHRSLAHFPQSDVNLLGRPSPVGKGSPGGLAAGTERWQRER